MKHTSIKSRNQKETQPIFVGGDIHLKTHTFVGTHPNFGEIGQNTISNDPKGFQKLNHWLEELQKEYEMPLIIGLENSCGTGDHLSHFLLEKKYELKEVNSCYTAKRRELHPHRDKSDEIDARMISLAMRDNLEKLGDVKFIHNSKIARACKELSSDQDDLAKERGRLKNQLRRLLVSTYGGENYKKFFGTGIFKSQISLVFFQEYPSINRLKEVDETELIDTLKKKTSSRSQVEKKAQKIIQASSSMTELSSCDLQSIRELRIKQKAKRVLEIVEEEKKLEKIQKEYLEKLETPLLSLKGCGVNTACKIIGEIRDIRRFFSPSKLAKYAGVAPKEHGSANKIRKWKSKHGNRRLYTGLYTIALTQMRTHDPAKKFIEKKIEEGKSKKQSMTCLIRHLINVIYAMLSKNEPWNFSTK